MAPVGISIIIPTYNESGNIRTLFARLEKAMGELSVPCEVIVIDDHSTDNTEELVKNTSKDCPVNFYTKKGQKGKGFSIMEGFTYAHYEYVCMLDADLQYPPELIPKLYHSAQINGFAVANRKTYNSTWLRRFASRFNAFVFGRLLLNLRTDVQSGLKLFSRDVFDRIDPRLVSAWGLDIPLVFTAYELGYLPGHVDMDFHPRVEGESKIKFLTTTLEIVAGAIKTKLYHKPFRVLSDGEDSMIGSGFSYKRKRFTTHTTLATNESAITTFSVWQGSFIGFIVIAFLYSASSNPLATAITATATLSAIYFVDVLFNLWVISKSLHFPPEIDISTQDVTSLTDEELPIYSILCPLYKEAKVLPQFAEAMSALEYPKNKLDVMLLLEEDDTATIDEAKRLNLPSYFRIVIVPDSQPKTKPKASNYGLAMAEGEYVVVYDAEDKPERTQLKKAIIAFSRADESIVCLQAKLNYYNPTHNILTRLFTAEYSLWFEVILPGLQSIHTSIPLGGTSNHFKKADLVRLKGWDPFNVTEDCDLGARLFKAGYMTAVIDSTTLEEANSHVKNWFRQRSRWIKGYMQTYLVHMRNPFSFARDYGWHALIFQLVIGGKIAFMLINPILWIVTISYFVLNRYVGAYIEAIYPAPVFYMAAFSLVMGNFICLYTYMIGCAKRSHYELIKYVFLVPFYWLMISWSACIAVFQLFFKPHYWEKTVHGFHLDKLEALEQERLFRIGKSASFKARFEQVKVFAETRIFGGGLLIAGSFLGNFLNFIYNAFLGRHLKLEDFGEIILISSILNMTSIPLGSYMKTITYRSAYLLGMYKKPVRDFWLYQRRVAFGISAVMALLWFICVPFLQDFFRTNNQLPLLLFTPVLLIGLVASVDSGYLSGNLKFKMLSIVLFAEPISKLLITMLLVWLSLTSWLVAAVPASLIISFGVGWYLLWKMPYPDVAPTHIDIKHFPKRFMVGAMLNKISHVLYMNMDILLAKHFLSPVDAGLYSFVSLGGKMVYYSANIFSQFINPLIAHAEGAGKNSAKTFRLLMIPIVLSSISSYILIGIFGKYTVPFLFGAKTLPIVKYLPLYALSIAAFSIASNITTYYLAKQKYIYPVINFCITIVQIGFVTIYHSSVSQFITVMGVSGIANLVSIYIAHILTRSTNQPVSNQTVNSARHLKILIFNWRDTKHKWRGGAEVYIHELAKRWVAKGHTVTIFCGNDREKQGNETIDGIQIIRRGGTYFVYFWAFVYYQLSFRGSYDVIIDSENGIPFFTPLYAKEKIFLLIHHVHQEVFRKSLRPPISWIGMFLERRLMPAVYRNVEIITVSPSSKTDILNHKLTTKDPHVVYNGVDLNVCTPGKKHDHPTVLYLGRLTTLKSINILIYAAQKIVAVIPKVRFVIAGDGPERVVLTNLVKSLGLKKHIEFTGKVSEQEKIELYRKSWVFVNPSLIEGWGITTIEANACGTPVVASNVAGLRDAVHNPHSGLLVPYGDVNEFTNAIIELLTKTKVRTKMSFEAIEWAKKYDWEKSADNFEQLILADNKNKTDARSYDTLGLMITMVKSAISKRVGTTAMAPDFPKVVGDFTFSRLIKKIGPKHSYEIALYKGDAGKSVFAKMRSSRVHDYHYLSLKNEIRTYEVLTRVRKRVGFMLSGKFKKIIIPELLAVHEDENRLIMFLEYRNGNPIVVKPEKDRVKLFMMAARYLTYLGDNMTPSERTLISRRTPEHMLMLLPFLTVKTLLNHGEFAGHIVTAVAKIIRRYPVARKTWDSAFIHRDLHFRNILSSKQDQIIIDLQQCVFADRLQEYVTILRYYWGKRAEAITLHNNLVRELRKTPGFSERMRWLSLQSVIHGLTDPSFPKDMTDGWMEYLVYSLKEDSFTREIHT